MSAAGTAGSAAEAPGLWGSFGAALRLIVGWFSIAVAVLNLVAELGRLPERSYLLFHAVLLVGGFLLVSLGRGAAGTGPASTVAGAGVLAAGMLGGALPANTAACCLAGFAVRHGYPFAFLARNEGGRWHVDSPHVLADLLFWGYVGLMALVLVTVTRRVTQHRNGGTG
jgi:hypothetical protein